MLQIFNSKVWISKLTSIDNVNETDIIIISKEDIDFYCDKGKIIYYEDFIRELNEYLIKEISVNYDRYYLASKIKKAYYENINTLCVGSSYAQFGIETKLYSYLSNCSLGSQDMYYSYKIIREVCDKNDNIENIVLVTAYYYFYSDLSLTKDLGELSRVSRVYYPLFNDLHNAILVPPCSSFFPISNILDIEKLIDKNFYDSYFGPHRMRSSMTCVQWENRTRTWNEISNAEKEFLCKYRAEAHNKSIKHINTFCENIKIFLELNQYLKDKQVDLYVVVPPATKYYRKYLNHKFKDMSYEVWNRVPYDFKILDLFDSKDFDESDFVDTDHLNDKGAVKFTNIINDLIQN